MLEQIAELVKQHGQDTIINNPDIPNSANNEVLAETTHTIADSMQNMLAGGGLQHVISLFTGGDNTNSGTTQSGGIGGLAKNPIVSMMIGQLINKLVNKFKMTPASASNVSNSIIPNVVTDLVNRTKDTSAANDSFDLNDLIGSLTGGHSANTGSGGGFDFQSLLNQFTGGGGNSGNGGGFDLQNIIGKITNGAQQSQAQSSGGGGGLMDLIKGFL